jgi:hypothetical protein
VVTVLSCVAFLRPSLDPCRREGKNISVAVCLCGTRFHGLNVTGSAFRRLVVDYYDADVFATGSEADSGARWTAECFGKRLRSAHFERQFTKDMVLQLRNVLPFAQLLEPNDNGFAPGGLMFIYWLQKSLSLLKSTEVMRGYRYEWVFVSRPDVLWMANPPRLSLLAKGTFYAPNHRSYTGVQPLSAIMSRDVFETYANLWNTIFSGEFVRVFSKHFHAPVACRFSCNLERLLLSWLSVNRISVRTFTQVSHIVCLPQMCSDGVEFCWIKGPCAEGQVWKYFQDAAVAVQNVRRQFFQDSGNWTSADISSTELYANCAGCASVNSKSALANRASAK